MRCYRIRAVGTYMPVYKIESRPWWKILGKWEVENWFGVKDQAEEYLEKILIRQQADRKKR